MYTHTHPFNGLLSGTTRVSGYPKGKTNLDFTKARDSEWQWHQLGHMQVCTSLQTDNYASTPPLSFFYRPGALPAAQLSSVILIESSMESPVHFLMLSSQAVHGLTHLRVPGIVPCTLTVSNSSLFTPALSKTHSFVFFAVHEICRIFLSPSISKASRRVSSFFSSVQLSQPY